MQCDIINQGDTNNTNDTIRHSPVQQVESQPPDVPQLLSLLEGLVVPLQPPPLQREALEGLGLGHQVSQVDRTKSQFTTHAARSAGSLVPPRKLTKQFHNRS